MEIKRTKIVDIFNPALIGTDVCVKGWVRTRRGNKQVQFIALNDGSTIKNVQIVVDPTTIEESLLKDITTGLPLRNRKARGKSGLRTKRGNSMPKH